MITRVQHASDQRFGARVHEARVAAKMTQGTLAKHAGLKSRTTVAQWESFRNTPSTETIQRIAPILGVTPGWLAYGVKVEPKPEAPTPQQLGYTVVPEIRFGASLDDAITIQKWGMPFEWLRTEMHVTDPSNLVVVQVDTACAPFEFGDRIIVDRSALRVSPPGHFMLWDGIGAILAHVYVLPAINGDKLMARVKTDEGTTDRPVDSLKVIGRVRGTWKKT